MRVNVGQAATVPVHGADGMNIAWAQHYVQLWSTPTCPCVAAVCAAAVTVSVNLKTCCAVVPLTCRHQHQLVARQALAGGGKFEGVSAVKGVAAAGAGCSAGEGGRQLCDIPAAQAPGGERHAESALLLLHAVQTLTGVSRQYNSNTYCCTQQSFYRGWPSTTSSDSVVHA